MGATRGAIRLRDVSRRFIVDTEQAITALEGVSLDIAPRSAVALSGPSGSGKSTLLHVIGALERVDSGIVEVDGQDLRTLSRRELVLHRRRVGFVFQRFNLLPALTVLDNVMAPVLPIKVDFDKALRARELLAAVGLADRETSLPSRLSGGQQQRVAIARALINRPQLVLADEPTGNLDSAATLDVLRLLDSLRAAGQTLVIVTHEERVAATADRLITMRDGAFVEETRLTRGTTGRLGELAGLEG
jgi:putative ABC transport system ATP-binding protein